MTKYEIDYIVAGKMETWLTDVVTAMRDDLRDKIRMKFDGSALGQSINFSQPNSNNGEIVMNDYWPFVEYGVAGVGKSGKFSYKRKTVGPDMVRQISQWTRMHGVQIPPAFMKKAKGNKEKARTMFATAIAYGVKVRGLKARPFFNPNFNEKTMEVLMGRIFQSMKKAAYL